MPTTVIKAIAAPRGIPPDRRRTAGVAMTATVSAAPSRTNTVLARSMTATARTVTSTQQVRANSACDDTITEYSWGNRRSPATGSSELLTRPLFPVSVTLKQ